MLNLNKVLNYLIPILIVTFVILFTYSLVTLKDLRQELDKKEIELRAFKDYQELELNKSYNLNIKLGNEIDSLKSLNPLNYKIVKEKIDSFNKALELINQRNRILNANFKKAKKNLIDLANTNRDLVRERFVQRDTLL